MEQRSRPTVLAVIDGYRVTGPARQLLAQATGIQDTAPVRLAIFQRGPAATPLVRAAQGLDVPTVTVPDRFPGDPSGAFALSRFATQPGIEILQTHGYKANILAALTVPRTGRKWIAFIHGDTWQNRKVRGYFALERLAIRRADCIAVVCQQMVRTLSADGIPPERIRVIHNACLVEPDRDPAPAWSAGAPPVIGVIGRLSPEKGVDVALRVHQLVVRRCKDARLWIVGEGPEKARLRLEAERLGVASSVDWLGFQEDVAPIHSQMTTLLIPSHSEGLPNVALEAMAHGVPVVATSVGGVPEVVSHQRTGFVVPAGDAEALASHVLELLRSAQLRRQIGTHAREDVAARFSLAARNQKITRLYEELLGRRLPYEGCVSHRVSAVSAQ